MPEEISASGAQVLAAHFACPACRSSLEIVSSESVRCHQDDLIFTRVDGIWHFLAPERRARFDRFIQEYETVREREGRGSEDAEYYRRLPFEDRSGRHAGDWKIRAATFRAFLSEVLAPAEEKQAAPLRILDLGAGNGWLSNRLARRGLDVAAVDLLVNARDGLAAWTHYEQGFLVVQAEYDRLPFLDGVCDLAIFNASFHYSVDYGITLREALRVLAPGGQVVILDSPIYRDPASGEQMVLERQACFREAYGFPSDALPSENYLTDGRLRALGDEFGIRWRLIRPDYGLRWALRPWVARARRRREPARFLVIVGSATSNLASGPAEPVPPGLLGPRHSERFPK
ncbi:MAG TPA: class I SAM-dependent methyltransferase [Anaerolineales bacterium]|nr:class I SAM-dependent methyltransferase [Anaerolineales bacterium]